MTIERKHGKCVFLHVQESLFLSVCASDVQGRDLFTKKNMGSIPSTMQKNIHNIKHRGDESPSKNKQKNLLFLDQSVMDRQIFGRGVYFVFAFLQPFLSLSGALLPH